MDSGRVDACHRTVSTDMALVAEEVLLVMHVTMRGLRSVLSARNSSWEEIIAVVNSVLGGGGG